MKKKTIVLIIVIAIILVASIVGVSLAVWLPRPNDDEDIPFPIEKVNPSLKHIVFQGLDKNGAFTDTDSDIISYAAVGYSGLVEELDIPSTYNGKPVVNILIGSDADSRFSGNPVISSIIIPESVTYIASGVFADIPNLKSVIIKGDSSTIRIGDGAFAGCIALNDFVCNKAIDGDRSSYLFGTKLG